MRGSVYTTIVILLVVALLSCSDKEQVYRGMYSGFKMSDQERQAGDPSHGPLPSLDQKQPNYDEYTRERELLLHGKDTSKNDRLSE